MALFKSKKGRELQREIAKKAKTFVPGAGLPEPRKQTGEFEVSTFFFKEVYYIELVIFWSITT